MKAGLFSPDVQQFLRLLGKHGVRYVVIGGTAVIYHGYARFTGDVDFLYDCSKDNVERLWAALVEFWSGSVPSLTGATDLLDPNVVVQFGRPPNRIDLIASLRSVSFEQAWRNRVDETLRIGGESIAVRILGLADLRRAKQDAGRPKDLDDLQHLP